MNITLLPNEDNQQLVNRHPANDTFQIGKEEDSIQVMNCTEKINKPSGSAINSKKSNFSGRIDNALNGSKIYIEQR